MQSAGVLIPPPDYLPRIREICDRHGVLLIYDEIITGCGRTGRFAAYEHSDGAEPDILCLGKGLTGGYAPLACVALRPNVGAAFWGPEEAAVQFHSGHTYGGNPVACAAGVAALKLLQRDGLTVRAAESGAYLLAGFRRLAERWPSIASARGLGMLVAVEYAGADPSKGGVGQGSSDAIGLRVAAAARRRGLLFRRGAGISIFGPPLVATRDELDWLMARFDEALDEAHAVRPGR
jgi:adenosylmethionine-8-amino-7-oxononanoate aminotransferase